MIGASAGDIIGSVCEQANIKSTKFTLFRKASTFTDDTVMSLALADAYLHDRDIAEYFRQFFGWYKHAGYGNMFKAWASDSTRKAYGSFGNGSAMRVSAAAYVANSIEDVLVRASESAVVTHNHPEGVKGAEAIALATFLARNGKSKDTILSAVIDHTSYNLEFELDNIKDDYFFDATCQNSVPQSLVAFRESTDFEDAVRLAISIGGDSDTIACMTGAIAGAFFARIPMEIDSEVRSRLDERLSGVLSLFEKRFVT